MGAHVHAHIVYDNQITHIRHANRSAHISTIIHVHINSTVDMGTFVRAVDRRTHISATDMGTLARAVIHVSHYIATVVDVSTNVHQHGSICANDNVVLVFVGVVRLGHLHRRHNYSCCCAGRRGMRDREAEAAETP
jgi:hypothetical protein